MTVFPAAMIGAQLGTGLLLAVVGWAVPRRVAGARRMGVAAWLDAAPLAFVAAVLVVGSGRPIFAGAIVFALGAGFAFVDRTMREVLREPVVFTALSELPQVFTHPQLYLPFAGTGVVLGGAAIAVLLAAALAVAEPAAMPPRPLAALVLAGSVCAALNGLGRAPWLGRAAQALRRLSPSGEPAADAAALGPVAMLIAHGMIARAERPARQARLAPRPMPVTRGDARPIILVQCESFFDARRALPSLPREFLAGYDELQARGTGGRLLVPAWGANTMRAEFGVLSGLADAALGYDRFNPYHALARRPIVSQVWRLRDAGYRTICLHPFDRRFFRRDVAMPALGFETFLGRETLGGGRAPPYLADPELARHILRICDAEGPRCLIFAITMGNHGPWLHDCDGAQELGEFVGRDVPQRAELLRYLAGLRRSDDMLRLLTAGLEQRRSDALLGVYGDHLPSLPRAFAHLGFADWRSDYAIASPAGGVAARRDLHACELGRAIVDAALAPATTPGATTGNTAVFAAVVAEPHDA